MKKYNTTQLSPDKTFERHVFHRDQFAHYLRWTHILKRARIGMNILDFGCGSGNLAEVLYRNRYKANMYVGLDIREKVIQDASNRFSSIPWIKFETKDLINLENSFDNIKWDIICSFEVIEHVGKENANKFIENIKKFMSKDTILLLSTPIYDESVGPAANHIINGIIGEFTYDELELLFKSNDLDIVETYGTFASQKDYKDIMNEWQTKMFNELNKYYDSNLISNIMAPMFPKQSRNCLWVLKLK